MFRPWPTSPVASWLAGCVRACVRVCVRGCVCVVSKRDITIKILYKYRTIVSQPPRCTCARGLAARKTREHDSRGGSDSPHTYLHTLHA